METKESKLIKLLTDGKFHTLEEITSVSGYAKGSVKMMLTQGFLDLKEKPYKIVKGEHDGKLAFKYEAK